MDTNWKENPDLFRSVNMQFVKNIHDMMVSQMYKL